MTNTVDKSISLSLLFSFFWVAASKNACADTHEGSIFQQMVEPLGKVQNFVGTPCQLILLKSLYTVQHLPQLKIANSKSKQFSNVNLLNYTQKKKQEEEENV